MIKLKPNLESFIALEVLIDMHFWFGLQLIVLNKRISRWRTSDKTEHLASTSGVLCHTTALTSPQSYAPFDRLNKQTSQF